jgi:hypothetical protein
MTLLLESLVPGFVVLGLGWVVLPWISADSGRARAAMVAVSRQTPRGSRGRGGRGRSR